MAMNWTAALVLTTALLASCGGGTDLTKAQLRLVNASTGYAQLDLRVDGELRLGAVGYGAAEGYIEVDPGKAASTLSSAGSATPLLSFTPALSQKKHATLLAYGPAGALRQVQLDDDLGAPDTGRALLRVLNGSSDAGALDVYLTDAADSLDSAVAVQTALAYAGTPATTTVNSGSWRLRVTAAGSKTDVRLDVPSLSLASKGVYTLVLGSTAGGVLVNALVLAQQGSVTRQDSTRARVRLAAVVTDSATVGAQVGGVALASAVGSPALGDYVLVPAGVAAVAVTLNGQALSTPGTSLVAGRDYTLLVHGLPAAPRVGWIDDDNRLPSDSARAKLRLIHGLADTSAALAMTLDVRPVAGDVLQGTASAYAAVDATSGGNTDGKISITATGVASPLFSGTDQVLRANAVYSVFLVGRQAAPTAIVRRDR